MWLEQPSKVGQPYYTLERSSLSVLPYVHTRAKVRLFFTEGPAREEIYINAYPGSPQQSVSSKEAGRR